MGIIKNNPVKSVVLYLPIFFITHHFFTMRLTTLILFFALCAQFLLAQITVTHLRTENRENPIGLDLTIPRFSWQILSNKRNTTQSHYEIRVAKDANFKNISWTTGKNMSNQSLYIPYSGTPLSSNTIYYWQVRIWDNKGVASDWSKTATWHTGFLNPTDWKANWISATTRDGNASPYFRKVFSAKKKITNATVFVSAHGLYELHLNGQRVGDACLTPGWTAYQKRLQYQCYDVTKMIESGKNTIGGILGNGWFLGELGWVNHRNLYGKELALIAQLEISYSDGTQETIITDDTWKTCDGAIRFSEIYDGESVDYRKEPIGWQTTNFDDQTWSTAKIQDFPKDVLIGTYNESMTEHEKINPIAIFTTPKGQKTLDFGQNMVGWVRVKATGKAGDRIILHYSEVLDPKTGNVYFENLRNAASSDTFYLAGNGEATCVVRFTFHGFRYVHVEEYPGALKGENFTAVAVYSDMPLTGNFECSNALVNQLQQNIQWGQRGNFLDVPTDCPQRDERMGWTGDAQVFANTALFNFDAHNFFAKWMKDVAADQRPDGKVPFVVPNVLGENQGGSTGWADVCTIIPWNTYVATGDKRILEDQYASMKAWIGYMETNSKDHLWNTGFHFGDWLFYDIDDDRDGRSAITEKYYIAQCFFAYSIQLTLKTAQVLGKTADIERYTVLLKNVKSAFLNEYITPNGRPISGTQTAYTLALQFDMLPESQRANAAKALVENIKSYGNHLTTGFLGTPYLCHVLTRFGYDDIAYELLLQETYPSWLYPVKMGATTIWERWDGIKPDSTFQNKGMNSFNHYAYGAIGEWMYRNITGINPVADIPGYKSIKIAPKPSELMAFAKASLLGPLGGIRSEWIVKGDSIYCTIVIPPNSTAVVDIPTADNKSVKENGIYLPQSPDLLTTPDISNKGFVRVQIGSGTWLFTAKSPVILPPDNLKEYVAKYRTGGWIGRSEIRIKAGHLQWITGAGVAILDQDTTQKDQFTSGEGVRLTFIRDEKNKIKSIEIKPSTNEIVKGIREK
ncbi:MAG: hypothetical protein RIR11_3030 [Bacteroidota bacterium]|jgi:alpha-L-rhamnosidase